MKLLFDQGVPAPLRVFLVRHSVELAYDRGWDQLRNGDLLNAAEATGFEGLVTTDKNFRYQQNLAGRQLAILVLPIANWPLLRPHAAMVIQAADTLSPGAYVELSLPSVP